MQTKASVDSSRTAEISNQVAFNGIPEVHSSADQPAEQKSAAVLSCLNFAAQNSNLEKGPVLAAVPIVHNFPIITK